jgi:hypothetical protein
MPASAARDRTVRPRNSRFSRGPVRMPGMAAMTLSASCRSAAK